MKVCYKISEKIQALSLAKECYSMKLELLTNATVVDHANEFVSQRSNDTLRSSSNISDEGDKEKSKEAGYGEDEDQLEEEQGEETGEITSIRFELYITFRESQPRISSKDKKYKVEIAPEYYHCKATALFIISLGKNPILRE